VHNLELKKFKEISPSNPQLFKGIYMTNGWKKNSADDADFFPAPSAPINYVKAFIFRFLFSIKDLFFYF
jgi:hypothetical protein